MPNWVRNNLKISADDTVIAKIMQECINEDNDFDFDLVVPMPDNIYRDACGPEEWEKYGWDNCWYGWAMKHWGTKWNCDCDYIERSYGQLYISFNTAWSTPVPIILELDKKYHLNWIECEYADEDMGQNVGTYGVDENGFYDIVPTNPLKKACEVWGDNYDDYCESDEEE